MLVAAAERGMRKIYQPGYRLAKAGVMLLDLSPQTRVQPSLLPEEAAPTGRDHSALMEAMDRINQRWGKGAVAVALCKWAPGACGKSAARGCAPPSWIKCRWRGEASLAPKHALHHAKTG